MESFRSYAGERSWWTRLSLRSPQPPPPRVTFADLARVHHAWRLAPDDAALSARYAEALAAFEYHHGEIDDAYWCFDRASGVAVTMLPMRRALGGRPRYRFHRATAWATQPDARVARLLNASDELGVRVSHILRGNVHGSRPATMAPFRPDFPSTDSPCQPLDPCLVCSCTRARGVCHPAVRRTVMCVESA